MSRGMMYHYTPVCDVESCDQPACYKVACRWGNGSQNELKNYGVYCSEHAWGQLEAARERQQQVHLGREEELGPVQLFELVEGRRDAELIPLG